MSFPKILLVTICLLVGVIGALTFFKSGTKETALKSAISVTTPVEIELNPVAAVLPAPPTLAKPPTPPKEEILVQIPDEPIKEPLLTVDFPDADRIEELFNKEDPRLSIVETIVYKSRVPWQKGRPAWLSDYAAHYETSRHFIARSLNGTRDYLKQDLMEGNKFNIFKPEKNISFYLLIDTSRCKLWFYYIDLDTKDRVLLKTYPVSLGRVDNSKPSGLLTPLGQYSLGDKVAIYKPGLVAYHQGKKVEMVRIFGTRWIPFEDDLENGSSSPKGLGIHGVPWIEDTNGTLAADDSSIGKYESDGCIRLKTDDMEEIFAIIITKPSIIELVKDFNQARFIIK